jgi:hypothetical protein
MSKLFYPTIDLFIYDLKSPLNSTPSKIEENRQLFLDRLPPGTPISDDDREDEYRELSVPLRPALNPQAPELEIALYPVRLNDIYGLRVDCSVANLTDPQPVESLQAIRSEIEPLSHPHELTIGQTWLISGWTSEQDRDTEGLARECYQILFKENNWTQDLYGKGKFLAGDMWELWQSQSFRHHHVIVLLFPERSAAEKAANFYADWMGLFCYRHKIAWAYRQSRSIKEALIGHYKKVEENAKSIQNIRGINANLSDSHQILNNIKNILDKYTVDLLNLSFQRQIIDINLVNYRTRLELIEQKAEENSDLTFLERFGDLAEKKYLPQIAKDAENMQLGLQLLETNINALRSQIEIEKSERDRDFQNLVTLVGAGTAVAALLDYDGKKCKAIFNVSKESTPPHLCDNFWLGSVAIPITFLILLGGTALFLKWLYVRLWKSSKP